MLIAVAAALVLIGLAVLIAADRLAARIACRRVSGLLAEALRAASAPDVRLDGWPFAIQFLTGTYRQVRLVIPACRAGDLELDGLEATLTAVRAPIGPLRSGAGLVAGEAVATAAVPLAALSKRLPPGLVFRSAPEGLRIASAVPGLPAYGTVELGSDLRRVLITPRVAGFPSLVGISLELPALPPEVMIESVRLTSSAVLVALTGRDVRLATRRTSPELHPSGLNHSRSPHV